MRIDTEGRSFIGPPGQIWPAGPARGGREVRRISTVTRGVEVPSGPGPHASASGLDVVVVAYESAATIDPCLFELLRIPGIVQVVVVDHGSDATSDLAERPGVSVVRDAANPGFGAGQNRGRSMTGAPYLLMCNPDAVVDPQAIADGVAAMSTQPDLAALQGVVVERDRPFDQRSSWQSVGPAHLWARILRIGALVRSRPVRGLAGRLGLTPHPPTAPHDVEALAAIVLLARRQALEEVHGFDPGYFLYWEDLDLSKRLRDAGWRLQVTPERWAVHVGGASSSDPFEREHQWWRGCMRYAALWYTTLQWWAALGAATVQWCTMAIARPSRAAAVRAGLLSGPRALRRGR
jgi:GT2 family glycosyltransferase